MAYRADIEIGVVGAARLKELQDRITRLSRAIDDANVKTFIDKKAVQSLAEYSGAAGKAAANLRETAIQLNAAGKASGDYANAISQLVTAIGQENSALQLQNNLIKEEIELRRKAKLAASGIKETTQYAGPIGPGQATPVALSSKLRGRTQQILDERAGRSELNKVLEDQFEAERKLQNSKLDEKAARIQAGLDKEAAAAAESAVQIDKLNQRQTEFTARTDAAAQAAARQTAEFYRSIRVAKEVAKINAAAGPAQLLLAPAAPGAPAMSGGARRPITGPVERVGSLSLTGRGARTADEAAATLRLAQATSTLVQTQNKIDPQYNRFLPSSELLNATGRGLRQLTTNQETFNNTVASGVRFQDKYNQELERRRRLGIGGISIEGRNLDIPSNRKPGTTAAFSGPFPVAGPMNLGGGRGQSMLPGSQTAARGALGTGLKGRVPGAVSSAIIGGGFPLLFGQGAAAAAGGGLGGLAGGLLGGGFGFALSIAGTAIGDIVGQAQKIKQLGTDIGFSAQQAEVLASAFKKANTDAEKFTGVVQNIRGLGLELESQAELIKLTTNLTEKYGGQFDKVGNAITSALESGKVSQGTLNQLTSQGVNIQQALADKLRVSKDQLLEMAKKGKIDIQDLVDVLVDMGNKGVEATKKPASGMEQLGKAVQGLGTALGDLGAAIMKALKPALDWLAGALAGIIGLATRAINAMANMLSGGTAETALANARARKRLFEETGGAAPMRGNLTVKQQQRLSVLEGQEQEKIVVPDSKVKPIDVSSLGRAPSSGGGGTDKAAKDAAREAARVLEALRDQRLITIEIQRQSAYSKKIFDAEMAKDPILVRQLEGAQQLAELGVETVKRLEDEKNIEVQLAIARTQQAKQALIRQKVEQDVAKIKKQQKDTADDTIERLNYELKLRNATTEAQRNQLRIEYEMAQLKKSGTVPETALPQIEALQKQLAAPETAGEIIQKRIGALQDEVAKLTNLGTIAVSVADSIGAAFGQAFQGIISGTMTTQEALASFFQSVGDAFIQMATEIIAKQITMIILQTILKALGGAGGGGGEMTPFAGGPATGGTTNTFAYGANAPKFRADGGAVRAATPYLVGERGPELFVPGMNGGVMSNSDLRSSMGAAPGSAAGAPVLNMSFETTSIGGVEYVSRDQLEAAMAVTRRQAASDGAKRGMSMTMDRLQQSPSARRKVGI